MKKFFTLLSLSMFCIAGLFAQWTETNPTNCVQSPGYGQVFDIEIDNAGNVYSVMGSNDNSGTLNTIYKLNGNNWDQIGRPWLTTKPGGTRPVQTLTTDAADNLYAAGEFQNDDGKYCVAKWSGISSWDELGTGANALNANSSIKCIKANAQGNIYAAGFFTNAAGYFYVAKWDGTSWTELGTGANALNANNYINTIWIDAAGNIYVAGNFTNDLGYYYVAKWDGTSWTELGVGDNALKANSYIYSIVSDAAGNVYTAGNFVNGNNKHYVAKWDGNTWNELGTGVNAISEGVIDHGINSVGIISQLAIDGAGNIYASPFQWENDYSNRSFIKKWDGYTWTEVSSEHSEYISTYFYAINAMACDAAGNIYAGYRRSSDGSSCAYVSKYTAHTPSGSVTAPATVCLNSLDKSATFTGYDGRPPYTFTYTINGGELQTISTLNGNRSVDVPIPSSSLTTYNYSLTTFSDNNGFTAPQTSTALVQVLALPDVKIYPHGIYANALCPGNTSLTLSGSNALSYVWSNGWPYKDLTIDAAGDYSVTGVGANGCSNTATYTAVVLTDCPSQIINTIAGNETAGYNGDGMSATSSQLNTPLSVSLDNNGNIFIADSYNHRIRKIDTITGIITTVAGNGTAGFSGDGGLAVNAALNTPSDVKADAAGNIFIADYKNHRIRKVDVNTGIITTVAGTNSFGYNGDGIAATTAQLYYPYSIALDAGGNILIADAYNQRIRKVSTSGMISTIAGTGTAGYDGDFKSPTTAQLNYPFGVATDAAGDIFIADQGNQRIRFISPGNYPSIYTYAGSGTYGFGGDGGNPGTAQLANPLRVSVNSFGDVFIVDQDNQRIRKVAYSNGTSSIVTVAGNGGFGFGGDGGLATNATMLYPGGVAVNDNGNIFIADTYDNRIRKVGDGQIAISATISGTATVCQYTNPAPDITFTGQGGTPPYTFTYTIKETGNDYVASTTNSSSSVAILSNTSTPGTFTYELKSVSCSGTTTYLSGSAVITVTAGPPPPVISSSPLVTSDLCPGTPVKLTSSAAGNYLWSTGATKRSVTVRNAGSYTVSTTNRTTNCTSTSSPVVVSYLACGAPTNISITNLTATSATINFTGNACAVKYQLLFRIAGTSAWTVVDPVYTSPYTQDGLSANTKYEYKMRTVCNLSPLKQSPYSAKLTFKTSASLLSQRMTDLVGLKSVSALTITLSPNPAKANAVLHISSAQTNVSITITDMYGKKVWQSGHETSENITLPTENFVAGMYFVSVSDGKEVRSLKLIKE